MKASDLLVKCLQEEGIEYIFGVPGEENADFMMCLEQSNKIKFILTRHEHRAAFMAEIYGRLTGNPAGRLGFGGIPYTLEDMQIDKMLVVKSAAL